MRKLLTILFLFILQGSLAQSFSFRHLSTANGLSDNNTRCVTVDKDGFLWIGTANGLNTYNGYTVTRFFKQQQPNLCSDNIANLLCDSKNRIWAGSSTGITLIDENRRFHRVVFNDSIQSKYSCSAIIQVRADEIIICTNKGNYQLDEKNNKWILLPSSSVETKRIGLRDISRLKGDLFVQTGKDTLIVFDYASQKKLFDFPLQFSISACRFNDDEILAASYKGRLSRISISQKKIIKEYPLTYIVGGKEVNSSINSIRQAPNGNIVITGTGGLFVFDPFTEQISPYTHDALQEGSIAAGQMDKIYCDAKGNVFIGSADQGISYFNILEYKASYKSNFIGANKEIYDGHINDIKKDSKGRFWLAGRDCFLVWDKSTNQSSIYRYYYRMLDIGDRPLQINCIYFDRKGQTWIGTQGGGLGLFNEQNGSFTQFSMDSSHGPPNFSNNFVYDIIPVGKDSLWLATNAGIIMFNINTFKDDTVHNAAALKKLHDWAVFKLFKASNGLIWISTLNLGLQVFDPSTGSLKKYPIVANQPGLYYSSFAEDDAGNIYMAGRNGFTSIDKNDQITYYTTANGLRYTDCEAVLITKNGDVWISNRNCLAKFDPVKKSFQFFDEKAGLTDAGFKPDASYEDEDGEQYWGTIRGLNYFLPSKLPPDTSSVNPIIYQADLADTSLYLNGSPVIDLSYDKNIITFSYAAISLYEEKNILYKYRMEGLDTKWINGMGNRQVRFSSLPPGDYTFKVKASRDGLIWKDADNSIRVNVHPAFWQTWWFILGVVILLNLLASWLYRMRISKIKEREKLKGQYERKIATIEMSSLRAQMNPHFMFNSLNSINNFILKNDPDNASGYLTKFSRLMRLILDNSRNEWVTLENELMALSLYIELEALRFDDAFDHHIEITGDVNPEKVQVPPMIIQPYVENAIWHGLLHRKEPGGKLDVHIWKNGDSLNIEIEDNGIGREEAKRRRSKTATKQKSHGMEITTQRLEIVNKLYDVKASVSIKDLVNADGEAEGTAVLLNIKYKTSSLTWNSNQPT